MAIQGLPATIEPARAIELPISIRYGKKAAPYRGQVIYLTDDSNQKQVIIDLYGQIVEP